MTAPALAMRAAESAGLSFADDVLLFIERGNVYASPSALILWHVEGDTLLIYLAAGDLREFFTLPHAEPRWIAFLRRGKRRRYSYQSLKIKIHGRRRQTTPTDSRAASGARVQQTSCEGRRDGPAGCQPPGRP